VKSLTSVRISLAVLCVTGLVATAQPARAQLFDADPGDFSFSRDVVDREVRVDRPLVLHDGPYVVVHLAENRVFVFDGARSLWSAPAGTGKGFVLDTGEHHWTFTTPRGLFRVQRMEKDPMWEAPDWHFVEGGVPIPPENHPSRLMPGVMGNTAIYLGDGIAIHGTNRPELLLDPDPEARRVSHGCIRLTNEAARTLMHMIEVGTPVLVF
jgi:L,D-transpeptidase YbiS